MAEAKWIVPSRNGVLTSAAAAVLKDCNANIGDDFWAAPTAPYDADTLDRVDEKLRMVVARVRSNIESAGRFPVSVLAGSIPPEAEDFVYTLVAFEVVSSTPGFKMAVVTEQGVYAPFTKLADEARAYVKALGDGKGNPSNPSEPAGRDYVTAVSADNPRVKTVRWGDGEANDDDYDAGTVTRNGATLTLPVDDMRTL